MQNNNNDSFFAKAYDPVRQATVVLACIVIFIALTKIAIWTGVAEFKNYIPWVIAASFLLFFAVFNSVFSLSSDDMNKYWIRSIMSYSALAIISGLLAYLASSVAFNDAGTIRWIFHSFDFCVSRVFVDCKFYEKDRDIRRAGRMDSPQKEKQKAIMVSKSNFFY